MSDETRVRFKVSVNIGLVGERSDVIDSGFTQRDWAAMTSKQREEAAHRAWEDWIWEYIDGGVEVVDET